MLFRSGRRFGKNVNLFLFQPFPEIFFIEQGSGFYPLPFGIVLQQEKFSRAGQTVFQFQKYEFCRAKAEAFFVLAKTHVFGSGEEEKETFFVFDQPGGANEISLCIENVLQQHVGKFFRLAGKFVVFFEQFFVSDCFAAVFPAACKR